MRRSGFGLAALVVLGAALWWFLGRETPETVEARADAPAAAGDARAPTRRSGSKAPSADSDPETDPAPAKKKRKIDDAEREAIKKKIIEGIKEHRSRPREPEPSPSRDRADDSEPEPGSKGPGIRDRSDGELAHLIGTINDDLMPLADECYEAARETDPELAGMLDIHFNVIADEDIGGLVDDVGLGEENEVHNEGMVECVRESILSTFFPSHETGEQGVRLTLKFSPEE